MDELEKLQKQALIDKLRAETVYLETQTDSLGWRLLFQGIATGAVIVGLILSAAEL